MKEHILVTGGTGFVGFELIKLLRAKGYRVTALVRSEQKAAHLRALGCGIKIGDLPHKLPPNLCEGIDGVFHTAAMVSLWATDKQRLFEVNVEGTKRLIAQALKYKVRRFVHTSSIAVFGSPGVSVSELMRPSYKSLTGDYSRSKYLAEKAVMKAYRRNKLKAVIVNPSVIVGRSEIGEMPLRAMFRQMHKPMPLYVDTTLDIVAVKDVAKAHYQAYKKSKPGERYIISGKQMKLSQILAVVDELNGFSRRRLKTFAWVAYPVAVIFELIAALKGTSPPLSREMLRLTKRSSKYSHKKAKRLLGYKPRLTVEALKQSITQAKTG